MNNLSVREAEEQEYLEWVAREELPAFYQDAFDWRYATDAKFKTATDAMRARIAPRTAEITQ
jgi:hypothetical protein